MYICIQIKCVYLILMFNTKISNSLKIYVKWIFNLKLRKSTSIMPHLHLR